MTLLTLRCEHLSQHAAIDFSFVGTALEDALDVAKLRQPWLDEDL
jgi:hypothetical protein